MASSTSRSRKRSRSQSYKESIASIKRNRTSRLARLATRAYYFHRRGEDEKMYNLICDEFVTLGGIYIKFLQGVLLQSKALKRWHSPERLKIFENLEHEPIDIVQVLRRELTVDKLKEITLVQPQPFAAGSFGQVYYGQHISGKPIIIKVLRPMVRELLRYDLRLLAMFSRRMVTKMSNNIDMSINEAIKDFRAATLRETDYVTEARFAHELYLAYKDNAKFIIPETFMDLCTPNIIVQEYVDGISVAQLVHLQEQGVDPKVYIKETIGSDLDHQLTTLGVELLDGMFNLPQVQGDPHPGNIRLLTEDRVGIIDFGISAPTPENKSAFFAVVEAWHDIYNGNPDVSTLFESFMRFFVSDLYRALKRLSLMNRNQSGGPEGDKDYTKEMGRLAKETFQKATGTKDLRALAMSGRIIQVVNQMINKDNRFGFIMQLESSEVLRSAQTYLTLVETLGRRNQVLPKVFDIVVERVEKEHPEFMNSDDNSMGIAEAIETISRWLERVATRDPALFQQLVKRIRLSSDKNITEQVKEKVNA